MKCGPRRAPGRPTTINRSGTLDYTQDTYGGGAQARKAFAPGGHALLVTFGGNAKRDVFDMLRDRLDVNAGTGAVVPPVGLILPSKYFPKSTVDTVAGYAAGRNEARAPDAWCRGCATTASRWTPTRTTRSTSPPRARRRPTSPPTRCRPGWGQRSASTTRSPLHGQYAGGFRAPPYSAINSGFTNLQGGYTSIPEYRAGARDQRQHRAGGARRRRPRQLRRHRLLELLRRLHPAGGEGRQPRHRPAGVPVPERRRRSRSAASSSAPRPGSASRSGCAAPTPTSRATTSPATRTCRSTPSRRTRASSGWNTRPRRAAGAASSPCAARRAQSQETAGAGLYAPAAYAVADITGWLSLAGDLTLRGGVLNLTDTKYFEWANVRGRPANDPVIDRYTSPGISALVSLAYGW